MSYPPLQPRHSARNPAHQPDRWHAATSQTLTATALVAVKAKLASLVAYGEP